MFICYLDVCCHYVFYQPVCISFFFFFFFKQKTAYEMRISDWSSDVCSSDLLNPHPDPSSWSLLDSLLRKCRPRYYLLILSQWRGVLELLTTKEIGRASCRERVCQYV